MSLLNLLDFARKINPVLGRVGELRFSSLTTPHGFAPHSKPRGILVKD